MNANVLAIDIVGVTVFVFMELRCQWCHRATRTEQIAHAPGSSLAREYLPEGWHILDGKIMCPSHTIVVRKK